MNTTTRLMTADELLVMPHGDSHGDFRCELVKGELRRMPPSGSEHGFVVVNLTVRVGGHVQVNQLGVCFGAETGFVLAVEPDTVRAPDLAFVRRERVPAEGVTKKFWPGAPDLAVEVLSPDDRPRQVAEKIKMWLETGALMVWAVDPRRRTVTGHRPAQDPLTLTESDELEGYEVVQGFRCKVSELFA